MVWSHVRTRNLEMKVAASNRKLKIVEVHASMNLEPSQCRKIKNSKHQWLNFMVTPCINNIEHSFITN